MPHTLHAGVDNRKYRIHQQLERNRQAAQRMLCGLAVFVVVVLAHLCLKVAA